MPPPAKIEGDLPSTAPTPPLNLDPQALHQFLYVVFRNSVGCSLVVLSGGDSSVGFVVLRNLSGILVSFEVFVVTLATSAKLCCGFVAGSGSVGSVFYPIMQTVLALAVLRLRALRFYVGWFEFGRCG